MSEQESEHLKKQPDHPEDAPESVASTEMDAPEEAAAFASQTGTDEETPERDSQSELLAKLDHLSAENAQLRDSYMRARADLENYRRRMVREKEETVRYATERLVQDLLPVLDNLQIGIMSAKEHAADQAFLSGFEMVLTQVRGVMADHGLETLDPLGDPFDPNLHESVRVVPSEDSPDGHVADVLRVGYRLRGRLLRPAQVSVSSGPPEEDKADPEQE